MEENLKKKEDTYKFLFKKKSFLLCSLTERDSIAGVGIEMSESAYKKRENQRRKEPAKRQRRDGRVRRFGGGIEETVQR